jgi:membrane-associated protease RseP (regulator of RpoE activity)
MDGGNPEQEKFVYAQVVDIVGPDEARWTQPLSPPPPSPRRKRRTRLPLFLFIATCLSTFFVGAIVKWYDTHDLRDAIEDGLLYALPVMTILLCHEMGHFLQSVRYGVAASWPYFLPVPIPPIGTMGAVIFMEPRMGHRRALFDIGITGPLAGLIPTLICCFVGIQLSEIRHIYPSIEYNPLNFVVGKPLLFDWILDWLGKPLPPHSYLDLHPIAFAGWVGLLITSLNLIPIGQLDGGHILYALLRKKAHFVAGILLFAAIVFVGMFQLWGWSVMLFLLLMMGPRHPPTANDNEPLGFFRYVLGWLTLAFVVVGFTPDPFPFLGK